MVEILAAYRYIARWCSFDDLLSILATKARKWPEIERLKNV
jgi:hypothetical protein